MKNYIKYKAIALFFLMAALGSCDQEQEVDPIGSPKNGLVTIEHTSGPTTGVVNEGDLSEIIYTVTLNREFEIPVKVSARQTGGTADDHDFTVVDATIAPYTTEAQLKILINEDIEPEDVETLELEIGAFELGSNFLLDLPSITNPTVSLSIENFQSADLEMTFAWEQEFTLEEEDGDDTDDFNTCDYVDIDIFIADAEGFDINDPWATFNPAAFAATGDCPEVLTFSGLPDGSYVIFAELWSNGLSEAGADKPMPITATFTKEGTFLDKVYIQDPSQVFNSDTPGVDDDNYNGEVIDTYVAEVTVSNGTYTIKGFDGSVVASGRKNSSNTNRTPRPEITKIKK